MVKLTLPSKRLTQAWSQNANGEYEEASPRRSQSARPSSAQRASRPQNIALGKRPMSATSVMSSERLQLQLPAHRLPPTFVTEPSTSDRTIAVGHTLVDLRGPPLSARPLGSVPSPRRVCKQIASMQPAPGSMASRSRSLTSHRRSSAHGEAEQACGGARAIVLASHRARHTQESASASGEVWWRLGCV